MCNIAGYAGPRRAAPILIDLMRRQEYYEGGVCTGITTVHEGRIYTAKVVGNLDTLLRETGALDLPGTVGIIHSRSGGVDVEHAHPFHDAREHLSFGANGSFRTTDTPEYRAVTREFMERYLKNGVPLRSAINKYPDTMFSLSDGRTCHGAETYALRMGEFCDGGDTLAQAMVKAFAERPNGFVGIAVRAEEPDRVVVGKMNCPMSVGIVGDESYIATTQLAFPEDIRFDSLTVLPQATVTEIGAGKIIAHHEIPGLRVEQLTPEIFDCGYKIITEYLTGKRDDPKTTWDLEHLHTGEWRHLIFHEPYSDCIFPREDALFKPYAELSYCVLQKLAKEGRLHRILDKQTECEPGHEYPQYRFWVE